MTKLFQLISRLAPLCALAVFSACSSHSGGGAGAVPTSAGEFELKESLEPLPGLKIYDYVHKPSGLEVFLVPQSGSRVVALATAYNVGSRYEMKGRTGLAHLFEHMMFRGTEHYPEPFKTLSSWGGQFNAYTSFDVTLYHEVVPIQFLGDAANFEAERMRKLMITRNGFDTERGAVVSERKMRDEDAPFGRLQWELYQMSFDKHPYKTTPIGWQEDLDATSLEDALDFYKRFYAPNRAKIAWVGDFEVPSALKLLDKNYGAFKSEPWVEPKIPAEPIRQGLRRKVVPMKVESVYMADSVLGPAYRDADSHIDTVLCTLLANGKVGFLSYELVEKKIARMVTASCSPNIDPELSTIYLVGNPGVSVAKLESAYLAARKKFLKWLNKDRIEQLKLYYMADQWNSLRSQANLAEQLSRNATTTGDPLYSFKFMKRVQEITEADIIKRYKSWSKNPVRLFLEPSDKTPPLKRKAQALQKAKAKK